MNKLLLFEFKKSFFRQIRKIFDFHFHKSFPRKEISKKSKNVQLKKFFSKYESVKITLILSKFPLLNK